MVGKGAFDYVAVIVKSSGNLRERGSGGRGWQEVVLGR